jgi:hypothetical protein
VVVVTLVAGLFVLVVVVVATREIIDLICVFTLRGSVVVAVVVESDMDVMFMTSFKFRNGMSNDGCDGGSSKNECNRKFDLNHF